MHLLLRFSLFGIVFLGGTTSTTVSDPDASQELAIDDLKDLLMTSIQNTIALNDLHVTQLTQKIVNMMITAGETTSKIEELEKTFNKGLEDVRTEIKEKNEVVFQSLNEKLESLKNDSYSGLLSLNDRLESLNSSSETNKQQFEEKVSMLGERSDTNNKTLETLKDELNTRKREAVVVSAESGLRDPDCVKVCGGTTRRDGTNWIYHGSDGLQTAVDISDCGFETIPILTTSIEGDGHHWRNTGDSAVYYLSTSGFTMYLKNPEGNSHARTYHWNVEWIAIGYTC